MTRIKMKLWEYNLMLSLIQLFYFEGKNFDHSRLWFFNHKYINPHETSLQFNFSLAENSLIRLFYSPTIRFHSKPQPQFRCAGLSPCKENYNPGT